MYIKLSIRYPILICQKMTSFYFPLLPVCKSVYPLAPHGADANTATSSVIQVGNLGVTETCSYPWSLHHFGPKSCQFYLLDLYQPSPFLPSPGSHGSVQFLISHLGSCNDLLASGFYLLHYFPNGE